MSSKKEIFLDIIGVGDGTSGSNKKIEAEIGQTNNPSLRYNVSTSKWQYTNDGTTYIDLDDIATSAIDDFTLKISNNKLKVADRVELNIALNSFRLAVQNSLSVLNMIDGVVDEFEDETGVDTGSSTNEVYDATGDFYEPTTEGLTSDVKLMLHLNNNVTDDSDSAHTVTNNNVIFSTTKKFGSHSGSFNGSTAYLSVPDSTDWDIGASTLENWTIDLWVRFSSVSGERMLVAQWQTSNDRWEFRFFGGTTLAFSGIVGGVGVVSCTTGATLSMVVDTWYHICLAKVLDEYGIYLDGTQVAYVQDTSTFNITGQLEIGARGTNADAYLDGFIDDLRIAKTNVFSASPNSGKTDTITIPTIEPGTLRNNMTLLSNTTVAEAIPTNARIVLFEEDVDSVTINTDIKVFLSRDGGSTFGQVTLSDEGDYESGKRILTGTVDLTQSGIGSGTNMEWKVTTHNNKNLKLHGISELWD